MISAGIDYLEEGTGIPIIFLHGIGGGAQSFNSQLASSSGLLNCRRIAWNMPGYGASVADPWPPTFESLSATLAEFIDSLGLAQVHLVGQSIGGMVALEHAVRRADQVATITVIASTPHFGGGDETFKLEFLKARLAPLEAGKTMAQLATQAAPLLVGPNAESHCIAEIESILSGVTEKTWRGILETLVTFNRRDDLPNIKNPCCLIAGAHDKNAPPKTMQKMAAALPNAEFHLIDEAGHMVNQEAAEPTNTILSRFIDTHTL